MERAPVKISICYSALLSYLFCMIFTQNTVSFCVKTISQRTWSTPASKWQCATVLMSRAHNIHSEHTFLPPQTVTVFSQKNSQEYEMRPRESENVLRCRDLVLHNIYSKHCFFPHRPWLFFCQKNKSRVRSASKRKCAAVPRFRAVCCIIFIL